MPNEPSPPPPPTACPYCGSHVVLRLPPGMDAEPPGEPGTVRVAWWRR